MTAPDPNPYKVALEIRRDLDTIAALYPDALRPGQSSDRAGGGSSHHPSDPVAAAVHALDVRDQARRDLRNHCRDVLNTIEPRPTFGPLPGVVPSMIGFLARWAVPYAEQDTPGAVELARSLRHHARALRALTTGDRTRVIKIGRCPVTVWVDPDNIAAGVERCHGELTAKFQRHGRPKEVTCDNRPEDHVWTAGNWHTLGQEITLEASLEAQNEAQDLTEPTTRYDNPQEPEK